MQDGFPNIDGFTDEPSRTSTGHIYRGRFTCHDVQWTGAGGDALATFTVTAQQIADAAFNNLIWTDQDVQRGIRPPAVNVEKVIALGSGYPDDKLYIFDREKADDITEKLLLGERLFLSPLVWNLRPSEFSAYWHEAESSIYLYSGRVFLPDSHHRHQAIVKAVRTFLEAPAEYPEFTIDKQFKIELYFLSKEDEGNYFFDKNQRTKPTAKSKAYDLTTVDDLSLLAKFVIERTNVLHANVNRVTDRLTAKNPHVVTLSTLREMMKTFAPSEVLDDSELKGLANIASEFYGLLAEVRPELGHLEASERRKVRKFSLIDSAVMMHGYAYLMTDYNRDVAEKGRRVAMAEWRSRLKALEGSVCYTFDGWSGDLFEKRNPLWRELGVVKPRRDGKAVTVSNSGATRSECGRVLRWIVRGDGSSRDLRRVLEG